MSRQNCLIEKEGIELFLDYIEKEYVEKLLKNYEIEIGKA